MWQSLLLYIIDLWYVDSSSLVNQSRIDFM